MANENLDAGVRGALSRACWYGARVRVCMSGAVWAPCPLCPGSGLARLWHVHGPDWVAQFIAWVSDREMVDLRPIAGVPRISGESKNDRTLHVLCGSDGRRLRGVEHAQPLYDEKLFAKLLFKGEHILLHTCRELRPESQIPRVT